jgi:circadian clock protein KaiC
VAGTGKTLLLLEFVYRGALAGEKGIIFSFEETEERLRANARGVGWDLDEQIKLGMVEIVFIPQPNIMIEQHLLMVRDRIEALGARRVAVDSVSVFLHKIKDAQSCREKTFQLASIIQNSQAVGFFATDVPYGSSQISRFGVEETVVDGVMLLSSTEEGFDRHRYLEVYKLRNTAHLTGRHKLHIGPGGVAVFPRHDVEAGGSLGEAAKSTPAAVTTKKPRRAASRRRRR